MTRADIAAVAHAVTFLLCLLGVIAKADGANAESVLAAGITAAIGLASQAVVAWKYLHHQWNADDVRSAYWKGWHQGTNSKPKE